MINNNCSGENIITIGIINPYLNISDYYLLYNCINIQ
jgi:hypothetical protein